MRRSVGAVLMVMVTMVAAALPEAASAASPQPAWTITAFPYTSTFEAGTVYNSNHGPAYMITANNVGGASTNGEFTVTDTLPAGLLPAPGFPPHGFYGHQQAEESGYFHLSCSAVAHKISCTGGLEDPLRPGIEPSVGPGEGVTLTVPVEVQANAAKNAAPTGGFLTDQASIEGGGAAVVKTAQPTRVVANGATGTVPFGFLPKPAGLHGELNEADGAPATQAGSHPYMMTIDGFNLTTEPSNLSTILAAGGGLRDATVTLPRGTVFDPAALPRCKESELERATAGCPEATQVGTIDLTLSIASAFGDGPVFQPLYNMVPPPGYPAELGFEVVPGTFVHFLGSVSSDGTFVLSAKANDVLARATIGGVRTTLWGVPSEESHDGQRGLCLFNAVGHTSGQGCEVPRTERPLLTLPSACGATQTTVAKIDGWEHPGAWVESTYQSTDLEGNPIGVEGCNALEFNPTIEAKTTTNQGDSPSGLEFHLHQVQHENSRELAVANLKDVTVRLPQGVAVNPSAAGGLEACSRSQIGLASEAEAEPVLFVEGPAHCPDGSKLGTAEVVTPVLSDEPTPGTQVPHVLHGSVYIAKPFENPFNSLLGLYLVVEDEGTGVIAKLAGHVEADPSTGQLTATFKENPELPLEDVKLNLFAGPRGSITTPLTCGIHTTSSTLVPWSTPEGESIHPTSSFETTGSCSESEGAAPKGYSFTAGTVDPLSGSYSPFVLKLTRPNGSQHLTGVDLTLPAGLTGKLAGIPYCSEAQIAVARSREVPRDGKLEEQDPSCPQTSQVGTVTVGAGSGPTPYYVTGKAYLAGPYKGAPLSMVIITPAVAGPFDLGVVVDRVALQVNLETAQIHAVADPLPTILQGIPLDVRSISLSLDRPGFTLNPTSCEAKSITGQVSTQAGQTAPLTNRFQVGECGRLAFKPSIAISLKGGTKRGGHPALTATVTYPKGGEYANIAQAQVSLPHAEFLDQGSISKACTKPVLLAGACPASSVYGQVKAWTPLLAAPLEGNVYLVGGYGYKLPALVAELNGQIRVLLVGKVDTGKNKGIRNTFEAAPDAPVEKFVLQMKGGPKYGLLENSENICKKRQVASAAFVAQNGKTLNLSPKISNSCKSGKKKKHKTKHGTKKH